MVLSNNDGCIVARNKEAKALGLPDLVPYFKVQDVLEKHQVHVFSSNYELYGDISRRIMALLENFSPAMEIYSIDEAFLDVTGMSNLREHGIAIKKACWKEQRMPVCVGIAPTKTLAKLANHIAKKSERLDGVCVIESLQPWEKVFAKLPVNKVWGVGSRLSERLASRKVTSVEDLRRQDPKMIRQEFGVVLERTVRELNGEACLTLETQPSPKKEIICSRSFSQKITELKELEESLANYTVRAAEKLRKQRSLAGTIYVMILTSRFHKNYYANSRTFCLPCPTNDSRELVSLATRLCASIYRPGYAYAKAGVGLLDLVSDDYLQEDFFTASQSDESKTMMVMMDKINGRFGKGAVFIGKQGVQRSWAMAREMMSPGYTTRFGDVPDIWLN